MINIDTADSVFHRRSREWWSVAYVKNGRLCWCGWPGGTVAASECLLVTKATPKERLELLNEMAAMKVGDQRRSYARLALGLEK